MAAVSASSTSLLRLARPLIHQSQCSSSAGTVFVPVSLTRCPSPAVSLRCCWRGRRARVLAVVEEKQETVELEEDESAVQSIDAESNGEGGRQFKQLVRPCELYVCNLPRSCGAPELEELFKPFGTVESVEVSRNADTGISKGCGFITMSTISEAKAAIIALDGFDLEGREIRVKFSVDMVPGRKNTNALNTPPKKDIVFESRHKVYVGNLAWSVTPEELRDHFSRFGTVVSTRVLHDRKGGKNRVYGFLSFSSAEELKDAVSISGTEFRGRPIMVRQVQ